MESRPSKHIVGNMYLKTRLDTTEICNSALLNKTHIGLNIAVFVVLTPGYIVTIIVFGYHWGVGRKLEYSPSIVLLTLATYLSLNVMPVFFSGLNMIMRLITIFKRVDEVLNQKEYNHHQSIDNVDTDLAICMNHVTATWGFQIKQDVYSGETEVITDQPTSNLIDITIDAHKTDFIAIIGQVGSGKTTLLSTIMNELEITQGDLKLNGSISYVEQEPFIISETVKNNILFGNEYNYEKLNRVIDLCCLTEDIQQLKHGLETKIGERGINISGGQKARISLARAVYSDSDIYLLDDPLSALDPHVGSLIYQR